MREKGDGVAKIAGGAGSGETLFASTVVSK